MSAHAHEDHEHAGPGYASPAVAREQPAEKFVYVACLYEGTGIDRPDFIAVVDVDSGSSSFGQIVYRTEMPNVGDELHHFGWNACSSACHSQLRRDTMIVPGMRSSRLHIVDVSDPRAPRIRDVIEGEEVREKLGLSAPHTVHCMPGDIVTISMLGDADGNTPGGFAVLDARDFSVAERWERDAGGIEFMYDFWYQPRQNAMVSSEWAAPNTFLDGFNPADVAVGKYGRRLHFWDLERRVKVQTIDLGEEGWIPLEIRWQHDPDSARGFVGATLSSNIIHFGRENGSWGVSKPHTDSSGLRRAVRAPLQARDAVGLLVTRRQHDRRDGPADPAADLEAVDPGQPYVEQHELDRMAAKLDERVFTATHPQHLVTLAPEVGAHERADVRLVLDDQDRGRHWGNRRGAARPRRRTFYTQLTFT